jgi:hypothetical protein
LAPSRARTATGGSVAGLVIDEQTGSGNPAKRPPHRSLFRVRTWGPDCGASLRSWSLCNPRRHATSRRSGCAAGSCEDEPRSRPSRLFNPARRKLRLRFCRDGMVSRHHNGAAHDDDLRSMERMSEVRIERFCDWQGNGCARECCGLGQLRSRLPHRWQEDLIVVSATDVLGSRPHHPQPTAKV